MKKHELLSVNIYQICNCKLVSCYCPNCHVLDFIGGFNALDMTCVIFTTMRVNIFLEIIVKIVFFGKKDLVSLNLFVKWGN